MGLLETRRLQMFPVLTAAQMTTVQQFSNGARGFAPGEAVFGIGDHDAPFWLVLKGSILTVRRNGLGREKPVNEQSPGQFTGEMNQLSGRAALSAGRAGDDGCLAAYLDAAHLRSLVVGSAEVGEIIMRALILRRAALIEGDAAGSVIVGAPVSPDVVRLRGFLTRNGYPNTLLDATGAEGRALVEKLGLSVHDLPVLICPNGTVLLRPDDVEAAACLGITPQLEPDKVHDVVVVGAGPGGLATAVYAASEGLSVLVLDQRAIGGQAGASSRIENYLGFPTGISGQALAGRAHSQALKFGAELALPLRAARLDWQAAAEDPAQPLRLELSNGAQVRARAVVVASGARYRRLDAANLVDFEGDGVSYWASPIEGRLCEGQEIALVGGGNSAGQAVVFLAPKVKALHLIVRGDGLEAGMSQYLVDRISHLSNVVLHRRTEVVGLAGVAGQGLSSVTLRHRTTRVEQSLAARYLFLFIGADPNAEWLKGCVTIDRKGFILTGDDVLAGDGRAGRPRQPLETACDGVFAIGDVRSGSAKRVAAAVGEGAAVVAQIHRYLAKTSAPVG